jgi:transcriptional regulator with XRE-family HTH domain
MELSEKLKTIRKLKNFTQETVAEKLGISTYSYAKIERGETDVKYSRLQQIAKIMGIQLEDLFGLDVKSIFNLNGNPNNNNNNTTNTQCDIVNLHSNEQTELQHELEKSQLMIEQRDKEIDYLKQQVNLLNQMINMLKSGKELK